MQISAEIRWFWRTSPPPGLEDWFRKPSPEAASAGEGESRADVYLRETAGGELGVKQRGEHAGTEVKGLIGAPADLSAGPFTGRIQLWAKWTLPSFDLSPAARLRLEKLRWLRTFDPGGGVILEIPAGDARDQAENTRAHGCHVELTRVTVSEAEIWWTFGFESWGTSATVVNDLQKVAMSLGATWPFSRIDGLAASYPAWLHEHAGNR